MIARGATTAGTARGTQQGIGPPMSKCWDMRRPLTAFAMVALAAAPLPPAAADVTQQQEPASVSAEACQPGSWVAGTVELCDGAVVYRDYVFDDYGADLGGQRGARTGTLSSPAGDQRYPVGSEATADLVDLTLTVAGDRLEVVAELNALYEVDSTVLALAIDTDDDPATGGGEWDDLGVSSEGWDVLATFEEGDPATNLITGSLPLPAGNRWRLQAATAIAGGPVMNVAFRGPDERAGAEIPTQNVGSEGTWFEDLQAAALADGDISPFGHGVEVADLRARATRLDTPVDPGLHERVYVSDHTLPPGEGMSYTPINGRGDGGAVTAFAQQFHYFGRYQPYGVYVPDQAGPHGLQFVYHGSNANHASLINQDGMQRDVGEAHNRLLVVPLARGPHGYGSDISERDLLDVADDVLASYDVDRDRVYAGGYSQGGYIAFRMAALYPDLFAGFISWVGFTGDAGNGTPAQGGVTAGAVGNMIDFVGNYRHVAGALMYGGADELVHASSSEAMAQEFRAGDFPYIFYQHPMADHFAFALTDDWAKEADYSQRFERVRQPARVTYRTAAFFGNPDLGIRHDRAYWVSGIEGGDEGYRDVDVTTSGCGGSTPTVTLTPSAGLAPVPWVADAHEITGAEPIEQANAVEATVANVTALTIDTEGACLDGSEVAYSVDTDGPVTLRLSDGRAVELPDEGTHTGTLPALPDPPADPGDPTDPTDPTDPDGPTDPPVPGGPDGAAADVTRLAGSGRIATAIDVARSAFADRTAPAAVLARADTFPDALAGSALAVDRAAPLLLSAPDALSAETADELRRVLPEGRTVLLLGGEAALSAGVAEQVDALGYEVVRYGGADRFETAVRIARDGLGDPGTLLLADGGTFPDALAAGAAAGAVDGAVLLTGGATLPAGTQAYLDERDDAERWAVGGPAAAADPSARPLVGGDRYATALEVAEALFDAPRFAGIATGADFPDALAGGAHAGLAGGPLLLSTPDALPAEVGAYLRAHAGSLEEVALYGGPAALAPAVEDAVTDALR